MSFFSGVVQQAILVRNARSLLFRRRHLAKHRQRIHACLRVDAANGRHPSFGAYKLASPSFALQKRLVAEVRGCDKSAAEEELAAVNVRECNVQIAFERSCLRIKSRRRTGKYAAGNVKLFHASPGTRHEIFDRE